MRPLQQRLSAHGGRIGRPLRSGRALDLLPLLADPPVTRQALLLELAGCKFRADAVADAWQTCRAAAVPGRARRDAATIAQAALIVHAVTMRPRLTPLRNGLPDRSFIRRAA
jgi:hypothetical protein